MDRDHLDIWCIWISSSIVPSLIYQEAHQAADWLASHAPKGSFEFEDRDTLPGDLALKRSTYFILLWCPWLEHAAAVLTIATVPIFYFFASTDSIFWFMDAQLTWQSGGVHYLIFLQPPLPSFTVLSSMLSFGQWYYLSWKVLLYFMLTYYSAVFCTGICFTGSLSIFGPACKSSCVMDFYFDPFFATIYFPVGVLTYLSSTCSIHGVAFWRCYLF